MTVIQCPKCGSAHILFRVYDGSYPIEEYKMLGCQDCYHLFNLEDTRPDAEPEPPNPGCCPKGVE